MVTDYIQQNNIRAYRFGKIQCFIIYTKLPEDNY